MSTQGSKRDRRREHSYNIRVLKISIDPGVAVAALCFGVLGACWGGGEEAKGPYDTDPTEPSEAAATLVVAPGFRAELFAAEPHVVDPVEICFDESGGIYVAEMLDYPYDPEEGETPRSRIRYLEDTDGDGVVDRATIFADELLQATSVFPWKGGLFVATAPDILYLKDTDGDHVADVREVWYTGFDTDVSPEARITNFRFGIDNWIYAANNGRPGRITSPKFPDWEPVFIRGFDFRFHPVTGEPAAAAGPTQFGMSFDAWGNRFVTQNTVHLRHTVIAARYAQRNPFYAPPSMLHYVPDDDARNSLVYPLTQPQQWRLERTELRQERYDKTRPGREELLGGHFTAATGTTVFLGDAWGPEYVGDVFVADANGSLLHREELFDDGATFRSEPRPEGGPEFLASSDVWFRPVNMANAPDGNLYLLDFYREYIEEPASIPEAIKQRLQLDFYRGGDRGRIWRIVREGSEGRGLAVDLRSKDAAGLVALLGDANGWTRRTAQRLLLERQDRSAAPALGTLAAEGATPEARLHALWTLDGLGELRAAQVRAALEDGHPGVRANAVRMAEGFLPELTAAVAAKAEDSDPKVRFQVALSAGEIASNQKLTAAMAAREAQDEWFGAALLTSVGERPFAVLNRLLAAHRGFFAEDEASASRRKFFGELTKLSAAQGRRDNLALMLQAIESSPRLRAPEWKRAVLGGLARGLDASGRRGLRVPGAEALFARWMADSDESVRAAAAGAAEYFSLPGMLADALRAAASEELETARRVRATRFLRGGTFEQVQETVARILTAPEAPELHVAALDTLAVFAGDGAAETALAGWEGYGPAARERATALLLGDRQGALKLLEAVENGAVPPSAIDSVAKIKLGQYPVEDVRRRAEALFSQQTGDRRAAVEAYRDALTLEADAERGEKVFEEACAKCHVPQGERGRLGPDLSGVNNKTREELLTHILDPSFEIAANYTNYIIVTQDGRLFDGLLAGETSETVTLRGEYENQTIRRVEIEEMRASRVSLMPDGLEEDLDQQAMADLIGYLRAGL